MSKRMFTESEKQELKNTYESVGLRQLARRFKAPVNDVRSVLQDMGVVLRGRGRPRLTLPRAGEVRMVEDVQSMEQEVEAPRKLNLFEV